MWEKWEYETEPVATADMSPAGMLAVLNSKGVFGWELCFVTDYGLGIFKRCVG